jgi:phospholipid/cholesterol/gamma-HCH transport system ATP-binding protein
MQKRTALARALVTDPKIVLFDELTTGQDPIRRNVILGMIAAYRKKYGFTAILISHDIPDVFFISNRVLALYDRKIIFQGSPEELVNFEHPFLDEITESIENLQDELTGLYSKRQFKVRYQTDLGRKDDQQTYVAVVFSLEDFDAINAGMGYTATQKSIRAMGQYIDRHFGAVGGFSARRSINQFETVLPFSDLEEATHILHDFIEDFRSSGLQNIVSAANKVRSDVNCFEFSILAGLALGKPVLELESVMQFAELNRKPIAQLQCEIPNQSDKN